ncbi:MAG: heme biosynthesis protein HemY, partial [Betaproteobacteria bacterium]|nr:heme biosynthesis protein HemY [Betaproteobacteria bacterium]
HRQRLIGTMSQCFLVDRPEPDRLWLSRIEAAQLTQPAEPDLQLIYGVVCWRFSLWGKALQMVQQAASKLQDPSLRFQAWSMLAQMAEHRQETQVALEAWKKAATQRS